MKLVRNFQRMLARALGDKIRLEVSLDPCAGILRADPAQLEQILMNLAVNARDAMPSGELGIEVVALQSFHQIQLRVSDTGIGMSAELITHIFEPFFTTKPEGVGTGLGLATVYGIVKQMGGTIEVVSAPGKGTAFNLRLPAAAFQNQSSPA